MKNLFPNGAMRPIPKWNSLTVERMTPIEDHPLRYALANELHARPFPSLEAPCGAIYLAIKRPEDAAERDRDADRAHLTQLLDRYGAPHPQPGATHWFGDVGQVQAQVGTAHRIRYLHNVHADLRTTPVRP